MVTFQINIREEAGMSQTNGQHEDLAGNGTSQESEFTVPSGPPISDFLTQLQDYNTTIPGNS